MADPILINQIITSMGLKGEAAQQKRLELEKLSNQELQSLLSNKSTFKKTEVGSFSILLNPQNPALVQDDFLGLNFNTKNKEISDNPTPSKKQYSSVQQKNLDIFLADFYHNSTTGALNVIKDYNDSVGWLNITDRAVNGFKVLTGQQDRHDLQRELTQESSDAKKFLDIAKSQPGNFEFQFQKKFGIPFNHENVENLKNITQQYIELTAAKDAIDDLKSSMQFVKNQLTAEQEWSKLHPNEPYPSVISTEKMFDNAVLKFFNGDEEKLQQYKQNIQINNTSIKPQLGPIVDKILSDADKEYQTRLNGKTYEQYTQEYNNACTKVFGKKDSKTIAQNFVENAKTQAAYTEIGLTIATSILMPGSSLVKKGVQKAAVKYGEKIALNLTKGIMTTTSASMPAALTTLNAATSEKGFTPETIEEIQEKFKNGMIYGGFGAYVSGPLGSAVEKILSKNPSTFTNIVSKTLGTATETSADVLFDRLTSDMSLKESLKENGVMNFGMMFAGGAVTKGLRITKKVEGGYTVKDEAGKEVFKANDENELAGYVMGRAGDMGDNNLQINYINKPDEGIPYVEHQSGKRTTEQSLKIAETFFPYGITEIIKNKLLKYPDALNSLPLEIMKKQGISGFYLNAIIAKWKPEYANIPFEKINTPSEFRAYMMLLSSDPTQAVVSKDEFNILQFGQSSKVNSVKVFDFSSMKNNDGNFDAQKMTDYLKFIQNETNVPKDLTTFKTLIDKSGDVDTFVKNYPEFSNFIMKALEQGSFSEKNAGTLVMSVSQNLNKNNLDVYEKYLADGFADNDGLNLSKFFYKAGALSYINSADLPVSKFDKSVQSKFLDALCLTNTPIYKTSNSFLNVMAQNIDNPDIFEKVCADNNLLHKLANDMKNKGKFFANQQALDKNTVNKIAINLVLMHEYYPENYRELIRSKGFKEIKSGALSYKLLNNLRFDDVIDDSYFYNLFDGIEQKVADNCKLMGLNEKQVADLVELDPARHDEILHCLVNAPDKALMNYVLNVIDNRNRKLSSDIEKNEQIGNFVNPKDIFSNKKKLVDLITMTKDNPDCVRQAARFRGSAYDLLNLSKKISDTKLDYIEKQKLFKFLDLHKNELTSSEAFNAIKFVENTSDMELLTKLTDEVIEKKSIDIPFNTVLNNISPNNIDFIKKQLADGVCDTETFMLMPVVKNMPEFKDVSKQDLLLCEAADLTKYFRYGYLNNLSKLKNNSQIGISETKSRIASLSNQYMYSYSFFSSVLDVKINQPQKYQKLVDSGFLKLVNSNKLNPNTLKLLNKNTDLSADMYDDLLALNERKSIVPHFEANESLADVFSATKTGDAIEIGDKMYINDGNNLVEWQMSKSKFLELFPPVSRFATVQGALGDCYLVSSISSAMHNPAARAELYKSFKIEGDDIVVTIKGYEDYNGSTVFEKGNIVLDTQFKHLFGCKGLQMLEQSYAKCALRDEISDPLPCLTESTSSQAVMHRIQGGYNYVALSELFNLKNLGAQKSIPRTFGNKSVVGIYFEPKAVNVEHELGSYLEKYSNDDSYILAFGTIPKQNAAAESSLNKDYNIVSSHAYTIIGYNKNTETVQIANPHNYSVVTEVPLSVLAQYIRHFDIANLK